MRQINYSINIIDVEDNDVTPILKYSGVYPSEAFKTPRDLLQSIAEILNEEFDLHLVVKVDTESIIKEIVS